MLFFHFFPFSLPCFLFLERSLRMYSRRLPSLLTSKRCDSVYFNFLLLLFFCLAIKKQKENNNVSSKQT